MIGGARETVLVMPQSFMNRSGDALRSLAPQAVAEDLVVVYDDVDLPVGGVRVRKTGGSGGHRGVSSVIDHFGRDFVRVRVGVGRPAEDQDTAEYVLEPMDATAREQLAGGVDRAAEAVRAVLSDGADFAMNRFNGAQASVES